MNKVAVQSRGALTQCWSCKAQFRNKDVPFTERPAGKDYEMGRICPNCGLWYHSFFLNDELKDLQKQMAIHSNRKMRRSYKVIFDKFNKRKRGKLRMKKINGRWLMPKVA